MQQDVLICVNARLDFFGKYYAVPQALQPEVDSFVAQLRELGSAVGMRQPLKRSLPPPDCLTGSTLC